MQGNVPARSTGHGETGIEALLVRQWSDDVVFFVHTIDLDSAELLRLEARDVQVVHGVESEFGQGGIPWPEGGAGRPSRKPWPRRTPSSNRAVRSSSDSIPSAMSAEFVASAK